MTLKTSSEKNNNLNAKERYEIKKRVSRMVSFNQDKDADILAYSNKINFSTWVKEKLKSELSEKKAKVN